jgi:hypothetical protein
MPAQALGDRRDESWVWLSRTEIDFGGAERNSSGDEQTVWLHADPFHALGLPRSSNADDIRRARRRLARLYHPDAGSEPDSIQRFHDIQSAARAIGGEVELQIEPISGRWWRFVGFCRPGPVESAALAVAGMTFEISALSRVPGRDIDESVRISYADQALQLPIRYSRSRLSAPVLVARLGALTESTVLVLLCLALVPVLAALLALDVYVVSDLNGPAAAMSVILSIAAGYGVLAAVLASAGRTVPYPRRAVLRTRTVVADLRSLTRSHG